MNTRRTTKAIIAMIVIGTATAYLLYQAIQSSWLYYYSVDEFVENHIGKMSQKNDANAPKTDKNYVIRLVGQVKQGTIVKNQQAMQLDFELTGQKYSVPVKFQGVVPKNFAVDKEVVVEGRISGSGVFEANKILTRCESKYRVKLQNAP